MDRKCLLYPIRKFVTWDMNVDLLNPNQHKHSLGLYPKIIRPSCIRTHSAILTDNIFTNIMEHSVLSGLLSNDTDHLPVFVVYDFHYKKDNDAKKIIIYKRARNEHSMTLFRDLLLKHNWEIIYKVEKIDIAYDSFFNVFQLLYDKFCPIKKSYCKQKVQYSPVQYSDSPWLTKGYKKLAKRKTHYIETLLKIEL